MAVPVKIYSPKITARHSYVFDLIFEQLLGVEYLIIHDLNDCHINYSSEPNDHLHCVPYGLLDENDVNADHKTNVKFDKWESSHCCYKTSDSASLPFDVFSATFFLISRYEEYLDFRPDSHNRFPAQESVLVQQNLIEEPLVNQWALILRDKLSDIDKSINFKPREFEYLSTIDIDQAWKFRYKGIKRNVLGTFRDVLEGKWENLIARWPVLLRLKSDPFQTFGWHFDLEMEVGFETVYFILLGDYGEYDKNVNHRTPMFRNLIKSLSQTSPIGIHPSYQSNENTELVAAEIKRLKNVLKEDVTISRQHFLMHRMPDTYQNLLSNQIRVDHTMGYSTHLGFRAGVASAFLWFDLTRNCVTDLALEPFCSMDITPLHYREETPKEAIETNKRLMEKVKDVGGLFISLWHNESLSETERWRGWRKVYVALVKEAKKNPNK